MAHTPPESERLTELTEAQVRHVARLARLSLTDAEAASHLQSLAAVLTYVDRLRSLDLTDVEPLVHVGVDGGEATNALADDVPGESLRSEVVRALAPASFVDAQPDGSAHVYIRVPKVLGEGGGA